jgi:hypothetical protein
MAAAVKKAVNIPVIAFGRINDPVQAEQILENGSADLVGMARQLLCDPQTPRKSKAGEIDNIRKCIGCEEGCIGQVFLMQPIKCIQNPAAGREKELGDGTLTTASRAKKLMVIGGGVAGLKFAEIAARRGHSVVLYEKEAKLGGQVNLLKNIPFRNEFSEVTRYLEYQIKNLPNVAVRLSTAAGEETVRTERPDAVVVATGAVSLVPDSVKNRKAVTPWDILEGKVEPGNRVVVYDPLAFNEGVGLVEYLFDTYEKVRVHYVTPQSDLAVNAKNENRDILYRKLMRLHLTITPHWVLTSADDEKLGFVKVFTRRKYTIKDSAFDTLVYAGAMRSVDELFWRLKAEGGPEVHRLGDAKAPSCVEIAIRDAELLARSL